MKIKIMIGIFVFFIIGIILFILYQNRVNGNNEEKMTKYSKELLKLIKKEKTYDKLLTIGYSSSGDMNGNIDIVELDVENKKLKTEYKAECSDPLQIKEYTVTEEEINYFLKQIDKYNYPEWKDLETDDEMIALDAPSISIYFKYNNSKNGGNKIEYYNINFNAKMPNDGRKKLIQLKDDLLKLEKEETKIKEYEEDNTNTE